jgi:hypothetical protein
MLIMSRRYRNSSDKRVVELDRPIPHDADHVQAVVKELNTRLYRPWNAQTAHEVFWAASVAIIA